MIPTTGKNFKKIHKVRVACPDDSTWNYPIKNFFLLATVAVITVKMFFLPIVIAAVVRETHPFIKIMQPVSSNYNWENKVKQIKITEENLSQSCIFCQLLRTKTLASWWKFIKHFLLFLPLSALYLLSGRNLLNMSSLS